VTGDVYNVTVAMLDAYNKRISFVILKQVRINGRLHERHLNLSDTYTHFTSSIMSNFYSPLNGRNTYCVYKYKNNIMAI